MPMTANRSYGGLPNGESALQRFKTASGRRVPLTDLLGGHLVHVQGLRLYILARKQQSGRGRIAPSLQTPIDQGVFKTFQTDNPFQ